MIAISWKLVSALASLPVLAAAFLRPLRMARVFGLGHKHFHHGKNAVKLRMRNGEEISFAEVCKSILPPVRLNPFLFNGHLQTMWSVVKSDLVPVYYKRRIFEQEDPVYPGQFSVDFAVEPYSESDKTLPPRTAYWTDKEWDEIASDDSRPMIVALHGLSGGSYELYLRHVLAPLIDRGWTACVVNGRGCALSKITTPVLFNARSTWDVRQVVKWLRKTFPNRPLYGVGFSLGANILTNYVGEEGPRCEFKAAVVLSCPWALDISSKMLQGSFLGLHVYSRTMGANLKKLFDQHKNMILQNPRVDLGEVQRARYLHEWDRAVQCPSWGYPTETAYYRDASSVDSVLAVRIPLLAISALDDPIVGTDAIPFQEFEVSKYAVLCTTTLGGHLAWFEFGGGRWMAKATTAFFQKIEKETIVGSIDDRLAEEEQILAKEQLPARPWFDPMRRRLHIADG